MNPGETPTDQARPPTPRRISPPTGLDRPFSRLLPVNLETAGWIALLLVGLVSRLKDLGLRAMSHDESLHALYSYYLYDTGSYRHDPMMHGPLLFHLNALIYLILGDSDFTARLLPALAGVGLIASAFLLRRYIGRTPALLCGLLLTISPTLLFYSRYIRNDLYIALFTLIWVYGAFRYLDTPRPKWIYLMVLAMALAFVTKEVSFLHGAIIGAFFVALAAWQQFTGAENVRRSAAADLAVLMLTLVLPFAAPLGHLVCGWDPMDYKTTEGLTRSAVMVGIAAGISGLLGVLWFGLHRRGSASQGRKPLALRTWLNSMLLFWTIQIVFFTTFFTNLRQGWATGIVGSAGYWLKQQGVARGGQPWFYYLIIGGLYEFLPMVLALGGVLWVIARLATKGWELAAAPELPADAGLRRNRIYFVVFCCWWVLGSWVLYSAAGERMPWLLSHITLPMCVLGAWWLGELLAGINWALIRQPRGLWTLGGLGVVLLLAVLTVRAGAMAAFVNYDLATEPLVYAHGTPDVKRALKDIETVRQQANVSAGKLVAYDDESSWPLTWYFRRTPYLFYGNRPSADLRNAPVVIAGPKHVKAVRRYLRQDYVEKKNLLIWWPPEGYKNLSWAKIAQTFTDANKFNQFRELVFHRRYPGLEFNRWPLRREFYMFVRRELAPLIWHDVVLPPPGRGMQEPAWPELRIRATSVYAGVYGDKTLKAPRALAIGRDGRIVVADTGHHRIVVLDRKGNFIRAFGSRCRLRAPKQGCVDPDGPGPLEAGDGQFDEPWGVAVGPGGEIYVADTWNGRIQVFDSQGRFLRKWGRFGYTGGALGDTDVLYGPRGLAVSRDGTLLVADTGNCRLIRFGTDGGAGQQAGGKGSEVGLFLEPVAVAIDPSTGDILVADAWNQRIQRLSASLGPLHEWPVPAWTDQGVHNKPYLAVGPRGKVYATDPQNSRVMVFGPGGKPVATFGAPGPDLDQFNEPNGVAFDRAADRLLVADAGNNRILVFGSIDSFLRPRPASRPSSNSRKRGHSTF